MYIREPDRPPQRAYERIAESIRLSIDSGEISEGSRLPSERDLALSYEVSRPTVREALMALQAQEYIDIKVGSGAFVREKLVRTSSPNFNLGETLEEFIEARVLIEGVTIIQAIPLLKKSDLDKLYLTVKAMKAAIDSGESPVLPDRNFHTSLAKITRNSVIQRVTGELFDSRHAPLHSAFTNYVDSKKNWMMALSEHEMIMDSLRSRDSIQAQTALRNHIRVSGQRWIEANLT